MTNPRYGSGASQLFDYLTLLENDFGVRAIASLAGEDHFRARD